MQRRSLAITIAIALLLALPSQASARVISARRLARGVRYISIKRTKPLQRIRVVSVRLGAPSRFKVALGSGELQGFERTSSMATRNGALVAINGDYARSSGRPVMTFARNGRLDQTSLMWGRNFAVTANEERAFIGHPRERVTVNTGGGPVIEVARVNNGAPRWREVALFTSAGRRLERPPRRSCSVRLSPVTWPRVPNDAAGVTRVYEVTKRRCAFRSMVLRGGAVLSTPRRAPRARSLMALSRGQQVTLSWSLGWPGVAETLGGNPTLVERGRIVVAHSSHPFFRRNPRTGIGTTPDGRVLLVAVDGRRPRYSRGITLRGFAQFFRSLGATWALNLDGGGSTTMVVRGRVMNRPSDRRERPVSSALLLLPRAGSRSFKTVATSYSLAEPSATKVWKSMARDAASLGGLGVSLARQTFSSADLERAVELFRAR